LNRTPVYVDASVIAGLILSDISSEGLLASIDDGATLLHSRFGLGEVVSAIAARTRALRQTDEDAEVKIAALRDFLSDWREETCRPADLDRAIILAGRPSLALKLPDAIHVAIVERVGLPLLTADRQQERAARAIGLTTILLPMKDSR